MKKRDLEQKLTELGFWLVKGSKHDKWTNNIHTEMVPRHSEVNEFTAKNILKRAKEASDQKARGR